jgi:cell division cycle 14
MELFKLFNDPNYKKAKIYHYCGENFKKKANAAYLMGAFQIICLKKSAMESWKPFENEKFTDYRDALKGVCTYKCTVNNVVLYLGSSLPRSSRMGYQAKMVRPSKI